MDVAVDRRYFSWPPFELLPSGLVTHLDTFSWACESAHIYGNPEVYEVTPTGAIRLVAVMAVVR